MMHFGWGVIGGYGMRRKRSECKGIKMLSAVLCIGMVLGISCSGGLRADAAGYSGRVSSDPAARLNATMSDAGKDDISGADMYDEEVIREAEELEEDLRHLEVYMNENEEVLGASFNQTYAWQCLDIVNKHRAEIGRAPLKMDTELLKTSDQRAKDITVLFNHQRPNGDSIWSIFPSGCWASAENIAAGYGSASSVMSAWYDQEKKIYESGGSGQTGHYLNIISSSYNAVGISCYYLGSGYGYYWVQDFAYKTVKEASDPRKSGSSGGSTSSGTTSSGTGYQSGTATSGSHKASIGYMTHVQNVGNQEWKYNGGVSGTSGRSLRLEGIWIKLTSDLSGGVQYKTHVQNIGWQSDVSNGAMSGTSGRSLRLEAIQIKLTGEVAQYYDIYYRVHAQNVGWMGWAKNGASAGTAGYSYRLEAIQIVLVAKGGAAPGSVGNVTSVTSTAYKDKNALTGLVCYRTHVQNVGWQNYVSDGEMSGTSGRSLRLEGINIKLNNAPYSGGIRYATHIQNIGWQGWKSDGDMSGTSGRSLRLEAIRIELTGEMAKHYDIYYRVHAQNVGWMGWAKNGADAGTAGYSYRLEGIQVVLVPKGQSAPGNVGGISSKTSAAFKQSK